jgi:predicted dehydrogenase
VARLRLGLVGIGTIARGQHVPSIMSNNRFDLIATASRHGEVEGIKAYRTVEDMIADSDLDAVSFCTPPDVRFDPALAAINAGLHVMLEKPPAATLTQVEALRTAAELAQVTLFASWHSRESEGARAARKWLADKQVLSASIAWKEDVRLWHPGQNWILAPGGFGVFDPGINALSIATAILPLPLTMSSARMVIPEGRGSPISANLTMACGTAPVSADFDFLQTGPQIWTIEVQTDQGTMSLTHGGNTLSLPDRSTGTATDREYPRLYERFASLVEQGASDVDVQPLRLVADAFVIGSRETGPPFEF